MKTVSQPCPGVAGIAAGVMLALTLAAGAPASAQAGSVPLATQLSKMLEGIPAAKVDSEPRRAVVRALSLIGDKRLEEASQQLNSALQLDPSNSYLQLINAFAYHLMAQQGNSEKYALAEQGYLLAVKFDASNWLAHYLLGMLYFDQRNFRGAQHELADVLLSVGEDGEVLFRMVAASYYAGDPITAAVCLERLRALGPSEPQVLRLSAIVSAAINQPEKATQWLTMYEATGPAASDLARTRDRVRQWASVYRAGAASGAPEMIRTQASGSNPFNSPAPAPFGSGGSSGGGSSGGGSSGGNAFGGGSSWSGSGNSSGGSFQSGGSSFSGGSYGGGYGNSSPPVDPNAKRMVLVDVVLIRTEDSLSTRQGVNMLSALTLQFGSSTGPAFSKGTTQNLTDGVGSTTTALTRAITIPALTYSLNIVNSNANLNEVLARPTLAALEGVPSEFFSGTTLNAAVVSTGNVGGSSVQIEKEIGVKLRVLPTFLPDGRIRLAVDAQRTFVKPPSADVSYTYKLETSKIMVNANVVMEFGETLVLGGLSEKETTNARDGVPLLQDIPGLQYLFSQRNQTNFQRSVLMLITPRQAQYTYRSEAAQAAETAAGGAPGGSDSMQELRARYGDWFKPYSSLASVFSQLNQSSLYREFRTGDVTMEKWDRQDTLLDRLKHAMDFLFF